MIMYLFLRSCGNKGTPVVSSTHIIATLNHENRF